MSYDEKDVLVIGEHAFSEAAKVMENGGRLVEVMAASPDDRDPTSQLLSWNGRTDWASGCLVQTRKVEGTTLEDEDAWDEVVLAGVPSKHVPEVLRRAERAIRPFGQVRIGKHGVIRIGRESSPEEGLVAEVENQVAIANLVGGPRDRAIHKVMLHVHNVRRCGGTGNFVYDMARCFPEFHHVAVCVNDAAGDPRWISDVSMTMRTMYSPQITPALLDEIDPRIVVLHATSGDKLEGEWPYDWLQDGGRRYVIRLHHIPTRPILPADLSVFVSDYIRTRYAKFLGVQIPKYVTMPPCTDMFTYQQIPERTEYPLKFTTGGKACSELQVMLQEELSHWECDMKPPGRVGQFAAYLAQFPFAVVWSGLQETWCRTVSEAMAAGCVVIAHRAGAIPEQIKHGVNGYLFDGREDLAKIMLELASTRTEQLQEVAREGRAWAVENVSFQRMQEVLYPFLTEALMNS